MDIVEKITPEIFNWTFSWKVNSVYHEIINCEIIAPQYSNKKKPWHFAVKKRKWYRKLNADLRWYNVTDVEKIYRWWCNSGDYDLFFYTLSRDGTKYDIRRAVNTDCEADPNSISNWCACACWFNKFMRTKHVSGDPRIITTTSNSRYATWVIYNKTYTTSWLVEWRWYVDSWTWKQIINFETWNPTQDFDIKTWDYVFSVTTWEAKRITYYDAVNKEIVVDTPWTWLDNTAKKDNVSLQVYPTRWDVLVFADCGWAKILHPTWKAADPYINDFQYINGKCISSITDVNGQWNFLTSEWFNIYWWAGLNVAQFAWSAIVGSSVETAVKFRKFNVFLWRNDIKVGTISLSWTTYINSIEDISDGVWIWSKNAYTIFQNSFYMVGNNKRLYALSIGRDANWYALELKDMSEYVKGDLDILTNEDKVSISADEREMKIYITNGNSTKILIYDNDYSVWHIHKSCCASITWYKEWYYLGDWLYKYCWDMDCAWIAEWVNEDGDPIWEIDSSQWYFFQQKLSAFIWDNEPNWFKFNPYQAKKLDWLKMSLWHSIINDESTYLKITSHKSWYKNEYLITNRDRIKWVKDVSDISAWVDVSIDPCVLEDLKECNIIKHNCEWAWYIPKERVHCDCPDELTPVGDYCICYDDKWYFLSDVYNIFFKPDVAISDLFLVEWVANDGDSINTTWWIAWLQMNNVEDHNKDNLDLLIPDCDCNQTCPKNSSCS